MCVSGLLICVYAYQFQLTVHLLGCMVLVALTLALGVRLTLGKHNPAHYVLLAGVFYIAAQMPVTAARLHTASHVGFTLAAPMDAYINLFWSPMLTVALLWLYISHMVSSCISCDIAVPRQNIDPAPHLDWAAVAVFVGMLVNYVIYDKLVLIFDLDAFLVLRVLFGTAVAIALLEIIYVRTRHNKVRLFNFTWFAYVGAWLYMLMKAL